MFVTEGEDTPKLGMAVEDSCDGEVKVSPTDHRYLLPLALSPAFSLSVPPPSLLPSFQPSTLVTPEEWTLKGVRGGAQVKELSRREGDGEFDEWKCFTLASSTPVEVHSPLPRPLFPPLPPLPPAGRVAENRALSAHTSMSLTFHARSRL